MRLREPSGDLVVLSWLYDRAARWVLHACGIPAEERTIHYFDLKTHRDGPSLLAELRRIAREHRPESAATADGAPLTELAARFISSHSALTAVSGPRPARRWYPVIDYDRCTHCMECIDFCLFGVYGVDEADRILVEQPDQCRKGCPACSRVCPENAIMFPQHKTPAIAGGEGSEAAFKMDLSSLFRDSERCGRSAPDCGGRTASASATDDTRTRQTGSGPHSSSADDLDRLLDALDDFDQ